MADDQQGAPGGDQGGQYAVQLVPLRLRQVHELRGDQSVRLGQRDALGQVGLTPGDPLGDLDARRAGMAGGPIQGDPGDVQSGHLPAAGGEPDGVGTLAAAHVERGRRRQLRGLSHQLRVRLTAPDRRRTGVPGIPERRVEDLGLVEARGRTVGC